MALIRLVTGAGVAREEVLALAAAMIDNAAAQGEGLAVTVVRTADDPPDNPDGALADGRTDDPVR